MDAKKLNRRLKELRFLNFHALLRDRYGNSPTEFCEKTGYGSPTTVSQLKSRKKSFGADLAREMEEWAGLERYALEREVTDGAAPIAVKQKADWPFTVDLSQILSLQGKTRREIDDALTKIVVGAQAQEMIEKQRRKGGQR